MRVRRLAAAAIFAALLAWAGEVQAACSTTAYIVNGQVMVCTTCCWGMAGCTVNCQ